MSDMTAKRAPALEHALRRLNFFHYWQSVKLALVRALWLGGLLALLFVYLDVVLDLPANTRLGVDVALLLALLVVSLLTFRRLRASRSRKRMMARLVEDGDPESHNEYVNAIDFEERLEAADGGADTAVSTELMGEEIDLALKKFDALERLDVLRPPSLKKESRLLWGLLALTVVLLVVLGGWFSAVLPRYLDPFGDHPPYNPAQLTVDPAGAAIDYGDDLIVRTTAKGAMPEEVWLVLETPAGEEVSKARMFEESEGRHYQTIENVRRELVYHVRFSSGRYPEGRSKRHTLELSKTPRIESAQVGYKYPAYTHLADTFHVLSEPKLKGYRGTEVALTIASNRPLKSGEIEVRGEKFALERAEENSVTGVFTLAQAGEFSAVITDVDGRVSKQKFEGKIEILADEKPRIEIVSPGMDSFAIPTAEVPIVVEASDDLGIQKIDIFRGHNESDDTPKALFRAEDKRPFVSAVETLDLTDLGLRPGDVIDYYASASDGFPGAPQTVASKAFRLQIISEEEYADYKRGQMTAKDLAKKYDDMLKRMEALREAQEALRRETEAAQSDVGAGAELSAADLKRLQELQARQDKLAEAAGKLAEQLEKEAKSPAVFDIEKDYKKALAEFAERLKQAESHMQDSGQNMEQSQAPQSAEGRKGKLGGSMSDQQLALEQLRQNAEQFKQGIQQANQEIKNIDDLRRDVEAFKQLYLRQKGLERQARSLKDVADPNLEERVRLKELGEEQAKIQDALNQLKRDLRQHAAAAEEKYPKVAGDAREIASGIDEREIESLMKNAGARLAEGSGEKGHPPAKEAMEQLEAMIQFCQAQSGEGQSQCEERLKVVMSMNPGETMGQLAQSGAIPGMGQQGQQGQGSAGSAGSPNPFAIFGDDSFGEPTDRESKMVGGRKFEEFQTPAGKPDPLAGDVEEVVSEKSDDLNLTIKGGERIMEEYRPLIETYLQRVAEDK